MPGPSYQTPSRSTFPFGRIPIVDKNGYPTQDYARYMTALEAKTNQTLSVAGSTVLNNIFGVSSNHAITTSSGTYIQLTNASLDLAVKGNPVLVIFNALCSNDTDQQGCNFELYLDGGAIAVAQAQYQSVIGGIPGMAGFSYLAPPLFMTPGAHQLAIHWRTAVGGTSLCSIYNFQAIELG